MEGGKKKKVANSEDDQSLSIPANQPHSKKGRSAICKQTNVTIAQVVDMKSLEMAPSWMHVLKDKRTFKNHQKITEEFGQAYTKSS